MLFLIRNQSIKNLNWQVFDRQSTMEAELAYILCTTAYRITNSMQLHVTKTSGAVHIIFYLQILYFRSEVLYVLNHQVL